MTNFSGFGPGRKDWKWKRRVYTSTGEVVDRVARPKQLKHLRFQSFVSHQPTNEAAKRHGLKRTTDKGTVFDSERQLANYLAAEKDHGRQVSWREH